MVNLVLSKLHHCKVVFYYF